MLLISLLAHWVANINLFKRLITLKSNLKTVAIGFYIVEIAKKLILTTFLANSSNNLILYTLFALSLVVLL